MIFALAARFVPNTRSPRPAAPRHPGRACCSAAACSGCCTRWSRDARSTGPPGCGSIAAAGVALLVAFVLVEARARSARDGSALLPLALFGNRGFSAGLITQASFQGAMNAFTVAWIIYLQAVLGFDAFAAGLTMLPFSLGAFIGVGVAVPLASKVGKPIVTLGALIQAAGSPGRSRS